MIFLKRETLVLRISNFEQSSIHCFLVLAVVEVWVSFSQL